MEHVTTIDSFRAAYMYILNTDIRKQHREELTNKFTKWVTNSFLGKGSDFEQDLVQTISKAVIHVDQFFCVSSEYGGFHEVKIGSAGYTLILIVLYCRYLYAFSKIADQKLDKNAFVVMLNHGLKINLRCSPICRVVIDVDLDNKELSTKMGSEAKAYIFSQLALFLPPKCRILITKNCSVPNTQSFHLITDHQFDVKSAEEIKMYIHDVGNSKNTMKVDYVDQWALPHSRFHFPVGFYNRENGISEVLPIEYDKVLPFNEWCYMAPIDNMTIEKTFCILRESKSFNIHNNRYLQISDAKFMTFGYTSKQTDMSLQQEATPAGIRLDDDDDDLMGLENDETGPKLLSILQKEKFLRQNKVVRIKFMQIFDSTHEIIIPCQKMVDNRCVIETYTINVSNIRMIFPPHRREIIQKTINRVFARETGADIDVNVDVYTTSNTEIPREFYEILLTTQLNFVKGYSISDVFKGRASDSPASISLENDQGIEKSDFFEQFSTTKKPVHQICDIVKKFEDLPATYTFTQKDISQLSLCYSIPKFEVKILSDVCDSIWDYLVASTSDKDDYIIVKSLIKYLYIRYCYKHNIICYLTNNEIEIINNDLVKACSDLKCKIAPENVNVMTDGTLSPFSYFGKHWNTYKHNPDIKIMLHLLKISIEESHNMAALSLMINSHVWDKDISTNAIVFLLNLFEKNRFICKDFLNYASASGSSSNHQSSVNNGRLSIMNFDRTSEEAPIKTLYTFVQYLNINEDTTLSTTITNAFRFSYLVNLMLDGGTKRAEEVFNEFKLITDINVIAEGVEDESTPEQNATVSGPTARKRKKNTNSSNSAPFKKRSNGKSTGVSYYSGLYAKILDYPAPISNFIIRHVVLMFKVGSLNMIYDTNEFICDGNMPSEINDRIPLTPDPEPCIYNFWYRRQMGIYNSFITTTDAHSPSLFNNISIKSPRFAANNIAIQNMFDDHLNNRIFYVLMLGIHFCKYMCYQKFALVTCANIYNPNIVTSEGINVPTRNNKDFRLKYAVSSIKICKEDLLVNIAYPPEVIPALYKTKHLKHIYHWFYLILCEMSKVTTIKLSQPSSYIFPEMDTSTGTVGNSASAEALLTARNSGETPLEDNDNAFNLHESCVEPEFVDQESAIINMVQSFLYMGSKMPNNDTTEEANETEVIDKYLTTLISMKINSSNDDHKRDHDYSPHSSKIIETMWNIEDLWYQTMDSLPITQTHEPDELDETIRNNIMMTGGTEFEAFILLIISWHIRMIHQTSYSTTKYMKYVSDYRQELYSELCGVMFSTIGPFFHSHNQSCLTNIFKNFSKFTYLTVDPLEFFLEPPRGFKIPGCDETTDLGRLPNKYDDEIFGGVVAFIIQSQFNIYSMVDLLKVLTKMTRPINRERLIFALLNRPRTGKNAFISTLTKTVFPTNEQNTFRYADLQNCENESTGNKLTTAFSKNLVVSFDEVEALNNNVKTLANNDCISFRRIFTPIVSEYQIMATALIAANNDPSISDIGMLDRIKVQDREFQYSSLNPAAIFMRKDSFHNCDLAEVNTVFAIQMMLQTLPKENKSVGEFGLYMLIWHMSPIFAYTQNEPCTSRWTKHMNSTMARFINATDPARYILAHKLRPANNDPITMQTFQANLQTAIVQDKTIPRNNFNTILHDVRDRLKNYIYIENKVEYIKVQVIL